MTIVKKFTIGIQPFAKMFRISGQGGAAVDAVLKLRNKELPENYFSEVKINSEKTSFQIQGLDGHNILTITDDNIVFVKDYYESSESFKFSKVLDEFKLIYSAAHSVLQFSEIRRVGLVAEHRYAVPQGKPSEWLRSKLLKVASPQLTANFLIRFEERSPASDGLIPDPKKADFINRIYSYNDSALDVDHPTPGKADTSIDVQRYFAPMLNSSVTDELSKLFKTSFEPAQRQLNTQMLDWGATNE